MGNRNHFLGPHFSFTKAVVRSLMDSGINNSFVGLFKEKEQKLSLLLCSQCHHSYANDNVDKAICIIILTRKWEETKIMQDICWNGCIVSLKKYHEFLMIGLCEFNRLIWIFWFKSLAYCLIFMRICVYDTYISIVLHTKHISFFFLLPYETSSKHDLPRGKGLVGLIFEVGHMEYFLLLPMVEVSSEQ